MQSIDFELLADPSDLLALGTPTFADAALDTLARRDGVPAAWQMLLQRPDAKRALAHVKGPFAVGWQRRDGTAWLAVDRFAVHTLCYRIIDGRLHFGERADQLAALEPRPPLDPQALFDYLYFHVIPSPRTAFCGVYRVPPGHSVWLNGDDSPLIESYWTPAFEEPREASFEALGQEFRQLLQDAVGRQLDGSKPACFLSGGTDSSTIAGMIGLAAGRPAATYSIGFSADGYDEMAYARIAARRFGTAHHEYYVTPDDLVRSVPSVAQQLDQPFGNSSVVPAYYCAKLAQEDGVTRLLAGDGGDELFGGNVRYAKQRVFGWYQSVPVPMRRGLLEPMLERGALGSFPLIRKGRSYVEQAKVPLPDRMQMYNLLLRLGTEQVFEPEFLARVNVNDPLFQQRAVWVAPRCAGPLNRMLAYDWRYTLAEADLPKVRAAASLAGLSVGFPFLDTALVDFSLRLPPEYKLRRLKLRWFFKEALRDFLPDEILSKRKHGFGLPFGVWMNQHTALQTLAEESLHGLAGRGVVRRDFVQRLLRDLAPQHPGYYGEMVWILMMLEQWLRAHAPTECV